ETDTPEDAVHEEEATSIEANDSDDVVQTTTGTQAIKEKFIEGGPEFMALVLICLILGLAVAIERIIVLYLSSINTQKFLVEIESVLLSQGAEAAKEKCRNTRGPI